MTSAEVSPITIAAWERHAGRSLEPVELRRELAAGTLPEAFHAVAREAGERRAVSIEGESATYRELDELAGCVAAWLRSRGVRPGDRVVLCGPNSLPFVTAYLGILRAGAIAVLAGAELTERELAHLAGNSEAVAAFAAGDALGRLKSAGGPVETFVSLDGQSPPTLEEVAAGPDSSAPVPTGSDEIALVGYTSGTTGTPKGAALSHANVLASLRGIAIAWRWSPDDVLLHSLPMSHQHGLAGLGVTLLAGSQAVIQRGLDPGRLAGAARDEEATVLFSVPAIYERLCGELRDAALHREQGESSVSRSAFASLRLATSGSAPLPPELWNDAAELIGTEPLERYGTTESGLDVSNPIDGPRTPGAVGIPLPGVEMEVVDASGAVVPTGADGEVVVRGPQVLGGYWEQPTATRDAFLPGGWFRTGDLGRIDANDGYLSITGRLKELIISGGLNVYPREVELVLEQHPGVGRAAVVGVPSVRWGEAVVAFVVSEGASLDAAEVREHARELLAPYKMPKAVIETDTLPIDGFGKLRRGELLRMAAEIDLPGSFAEGRPPGDR